MHITWMCTVVNDVEHAPIVCAVNAELMFAFKNHKSAMLDSLYSIENKFKKKRIK